MPDAFCSSRPQERIGPCSDLYLNVTQFEALFKARKVGFYLSPDSQLSLSQQASLPRSDFSNLREQDLLPSLMRSPPTLYIKGDSHITAYSTPVHQPRTLHFTLRLRTTLQLAYAL
ncbi:MAG: hypothetical protein M1812_004977 [Candelaria pacifica]|nr:MAG: hypothetical protein M1812_004977 [Candelaria pacifica]